MFHWTFADCSAILPCRRSNHSWCNRDLRPYLHSHHFTGRRRSSLSRELTRFVVLQNTDQVNLGRALAAHADQDGLNHPPLMRLRARALSNKYTNSERMSLETVSHVPCLTFLIGIALRNTRRRSCRTQTITIPAPTF